MAEIVRQISKNTYRVLFVNYGNYENVHVKDIKSIDKRESEKVDLDKASTIMDMDDFDMKTGDRIEGTLSTGGASMGGGGGGGGRSHKREVAPMIIRENQERSNYIHKKVALCVMTGKGCEVYTVLGHQVSRLKRIKAPGGGIKATASRRGGQSALRFARIAQSNRERWVKRICEELNDLKDDLDGLTIYLCGGSDLKLLFRSIAFKLLNHEIFIHLNICDKNDISSTKTSTPSKFKDDRGKTRQAMLSDHEVMLVLKVAMRQ